MDYWTEFLDSEWYAEWPQRPRPPHTLDPWRHKDRGLVLLVPRELVELVVQETRVIELERYASERIEAIALSIAESGLEEPLKWTVDLSGRVALTDGHHRTIATRRWEHFSKLPVTIVMTERLRVHRCATLGPILVDLLLGAERPR